MEPEIIAGLTKFEWSKDKAWFPQLSPEPGLAHAFVQYPWRYKSIDLDVKEPVFYDGERDGTVAQCGATIRVLLPLKFNGKDPRACPRCVQALASA